MTKLQKLQLRQSELREIVNGLLDKESLTDEETADLKKHTGELQALEPQLRAALVVDDSEDVHHGTVDAESRELQKLEQKASIGNYVVAKAQHRQLDGVEKEYSQALKLGVDEFPLRLLGRRGVDPQRADVQKRAVTDVDVVSRPRPWVDRLFASTAADYLGFRAEEVESGESAHPITTAGGTPAQRGRSEATTEAAWPVGVSSLKPTRMSIRVTYTIEDAARVPMLDAALERDMRMAIGERVDHVLFNGDSGANEDAADITGFFASGAAETELTQANKVKADKVLEALVTFIDGIHAESPADVRIVSSVGANRLWMSTIHNPTATNETVADILRDSGFTWRTRAGIDTATAADDFLAAVGLQRGIEGAGVVAFWPAGEMIVDPYSGSSKGEIAMQLNVLWNYGIVRAANFKRLKAVA